MSISESFVCTVPDWYVQRIYLRYFSSKYHRTFYYRNEDMTDENFPMVSDTLFAGMKYEVSFIPVFADKKSIHANQCIAELAMRGSLLTGPYALSLVWELHREKFPRDRWTVSFDSAERLWKDPSGLVRVPALKPLMNDRWLFGMADFHGGFNGGDCMLRIVQI